MSRPRLAISPEQYAALRDQIMTAGGVLQSLRPGVLDEVAGAIEADLRDAQSLILTTIVRRRAEKFAKALRAAETLRIACHEAAAAFDLIDPNEGAPQ